MYVLPVIGGSYVCLACYRGVICMSCLLSGVIIMYVLHVIGGHMYVLPVIGGSYVCLACYRGS